jgi:hypothetical protein
MTLVHPLALGLLVPAALLLYWRLRGAPEDRRPVASLELWRAVKERISPARPRRRFSLEFWLEAALLIGAILALAGPYFWVAASSGGSPLRRVVVDSGAAMQTPTRRAEVERILTEEGLREAPRRELPETEERWSRTSTTSWGPLLAREMAADDRVLLIVDAISREDRLPEGVSCRVVSRSFPNLAWIAAELREEDGAGLRLFAAALRTEGAADMKVEGRYELRHGEKTIATGILDFRDEGRAELDLSIEAPAERLPVELILRPHSRADLASGSNLDEIAGDDRLRFLPPSGGARIALPMGSDFDLIADALDALGRRVLRGPIPPGMRFDGLRLRRRGQPEGDRESSMLRWLFPAAAEPPGKPLAGWIEPVSSRFDDLAGFSLRARAAEALVVEPGDDVLFAIEGQAVILQRGATLIWGLDPAREDWGRDLAFLRLVSLLLPAARGSMSTRDAGAAFGRDGGEAAVSEGIWALEAELLDEAESRGLAGPGGEIVAPSTSTGLRARSLARPLLVIALLALAALVVLRGAARLRTLRLR